MSTHKIGLSRGQKLSIRIADQHICYRLFGLPLVLTNLVLLGASFCLNSVLRLSLEAREHLQVKTQNVSFSEYMVLRTICMRHLKRVRLSACHSKPV